MLKDKDGVMKTNMVREGNFTTTMRSHPRQCWIWFLITKTGESATIDIRQEKDKEDRALCESGTI